MNANRRHDTLKTMMVTIVLSVTTMAVCAQDFLSTKTVTLKKSSGKASYSASVEFPTDGSPAVLKEIMQWMNIVLETDGENRREFQAILQNSCDNFFGYGEDWKRDIVIERDYEDSRIVTFTSQVTDTDDEKWVAEDCATFSKKDGHRVTLDEIFRCGEDDIKYLMWEYRDDLSLDVDESAGLAPINGGFIDGWVLVTSPAHNATSRIFRLRYEEIVSYLRKHDEGYF